MNIDELAVRPNPSGSITMLFLPGTLVIRLWARSATQQRARVDSGRCVALPGALTDERLGQAALDAMFEASGLVSASTFAEAKALCPAYLAEAAGLDGLGSIAEMALAVTVGRSRANGRVFVGATRNDHTASLEFTGLPRPAQLASPTALELGQAIRQKLRESS